VEKLTFTSVGKALKDIFAKIDDPRNYRWRNVSLIGADIPIKLAEESAKEVANDFILRRFDGDLATARSSPPYMWKAHIVARYIPQITVLLEALTEGRYWCLLTETMLMNQLYNVVISVNPHLSWEKQTWPKENQKPRRLTTHQQKMKANILSTLELLKNLWIDNFQGVGADEVRLSIGDVQERIRKYTNR
jgi:hypothetical protein